MCRIGYAETVRAVALAGGRSAVKRVERDWLAFDVIEVDRAVAEHAAELAPLHARVWLFWMPPWST
jgi:hypothetical protein